MEKTQSIMPVLKKSGITTPPVTTLPVDEAPAKEDPAKNPNLPEFVK